MADPVLQWKTHITDSTDRETILGNLDFLESFAGAINGGDDYTINGIEGSLSVQFETLRTEIKNGTIKPPEWKTSAPFTTITTALTNASSGKLATLAAQGEGFEKQLGKVKGDITSQGTQLTDAESNIKKQTDKLNQQELTITSQGTRLTDAETAIGKKLNSKTFEEFKLGDFKVIKDKLPSLASSDELKNLKILLNKEVSHWTAEEKPLPQSYTAAAQVKASKQPWGENEDPERHIGDLCTVIGEKATDKGVSYRFVKHPNPTEDTYKWLKVIDNDGALALSKQTEFEKDYNTRQIAIDSALDNKQRKGNYIEKTDFEANNAKVDQEIKELKGTYKVTVTTQGEIRNGEIVGGKTHDGKPAILHTAHVYGILGNKITDTTIINKLKWTVNSGRTTSPVQRFETGATCYVTADDFVRVLHTQGSNPQFYDVELNSNF